MMHHCANYSLAESEGLFQELQLDLVAVTADLEKWHGLTKKPAEALMMVHANVLLLWDLSELTRKGKSVQSPDMKMRHKSLVAKSGDLLHKIAEQVKATCDVGRL